MGISEEKNQVSRLIWIKALIDMMVSVIGSEWRFRPQIDLMH